MSKVHQLPKGIHIAPMPRRVEGDVGRKLQGGLPPVAYRSCNAKWSGAAKFAREPMPYAQRQLCAENADWQHTHCMSEQLGFTLPIYPIIQGLELDKSMDKLKSLINQ